jgi:hypothetical protein
MPVLKARRKTQEFCIAKDAKERHAKSTEERHTKGAKF